MGDVSWEKQQEVRRETLEVRSERRKKMEEVRRKKEKERSRNENNPNSFLLLLTSHFYLLTF